jgi:hypothetical protein
LARICIPHLEHCRKLMKWIDIFNTTDQTIELLRKSRIEFFLKELFNITLIS